MDRIEVCIKISPYTAGNADAVTAEISDLGFGSFVEEDPFLKAYIPLGFYSEQNLKTKLSGFAFTDFEVSFTAGLVREIDWNSEAEKDFPPFTVRSGGDGVGCCVKPLRKTDAPRTRYSIKIDPDKSFGTARRQSAGMMIGYMLEDRADLAGKKLLDMGCGSGILSIMAAKLHCATPVEAVDASAAAVVAARRNASANRMSGRINTVRGDSTILEMGRYEVIFADVSPDELLEDMRTYALSLKTGGKLYISGFSTGDIPVLAEECSKNGLRVLSSKEEEGRAAMKLEKLNFAPR